MARLKTLWNKLLGRKPQVPIVYETPTFLDSALFGCGDGRIRDQSKGEEAMCYFGTIFATTEQRDLAVLLMNKQDMQRRSAEAWSHSSRNRNRVAG